MEGHHHKDNQQGSALPPRPQYVSALPPRPEYLQDTASTSSQSGQGHSGHHIQDGMANLRTGADEEEDTLKQDKKERDEFEKVVRLTKEKFEGLRTAMCSTIEYKEKRRIIHKKYFVYGALIHILQQANLVAEGFFLDKNSTKHRKDMAVRVRTQILNLISKRCPQLNKSPEDTKDIELIKTYRCTDPKKPSACEIGRELHAKQRYGNLNFLLERVLHPENSETEVMFEELQVLVIAIMQGEIVKIKDLLQRLHEYATTTLYSHGDMWEDKPSASRDYSTPLSEKGTAFLGMFVVTQEIANMNWGVYFDNATPCWIESEKEWKTSLIGKCNTLEAYIDQRL